MKDKDYLYLGIIALGLLLGCLYIGIELRGLTKEIAATRQVLEQEIAQQRRLEELAKETIRKFGLE